MLLIKLEPKIAFIMAIIKVIKFLDSCNDFVEALIAGMIAWNKTGDFVYGSSVMFAYMLIDYVKDEIVEAICVKLGGRKIIETGLKWFYLSRNYLRERWA